MSTTTVQDIKVIIGDTSQNESSEELTKIFIKEFAKVSKEIAEKKVAYKQMEAQINNTKKGAEATKATAKSSTKTTTTSAKGGADATTAEKTSSSASASGTTSSASGGGAATTVEKTSKSASASDTSTSTEGGATVSPPTTDSTTPSVPEVSADTSSTVQSYSSVDSQQTLSVPKNIQESTTEPSLTKVKEEVQKKLTDATSEADISYWTGIKDKLEAGSTHKELLGEKDDLFTQLYTRLSEDNVSKTEETSISGYNWDDIKKGMTTAIEGKIIASENDSDTNKHWNTILTKLGTEDVDIEKLFSEYEELFLLLREVKELDALPSKITITKTSKPYVNLSTNKVYASIGRKDVYPFLKSLPDLVGKDVLKIFIAKVTGTVFGTGDMLSFGISNFGSNKAEKKNINWIIYDASGTVLIKKIDQGKTFTHQFNDFGNYIVQAHGGEPNDVSLVLAEESSKAKYKSKKRKNYMAVTIKPAVLTGIKSNKGKHFKKDTALTFTPIFDVATTSAPALNWIHYYKKSETTDYVATPLPNFTGTHTFTQKGWHYISASMINGENTKEFKAGSKKKPIVIGGNYITTITETKHKKSLILLNKTTTLEFKPTGYKLGKGEDITKDEITWFVTKDKKEVAKGTGASFVIPDTKAYKEGEYTVKAFANDPMYKNKAATTSFTITHPQVTKANWEDSSGTLKLQTGYQKKVENYITASIPNYTNAPVIIGIYQDAEHKKLISSFDTQTDKDGMVNLQLCLGDDTAINKFITTSKKATVDLYFNIQGKEYTFKKSIANSKLSKITVDKESKILRSYFMYDGNIISSHLQAVPYGTEIKFVAETTNMIGQKIKLELYKTDSPDKYNGKYVTENNSPVVDTDGKVVVTFKLKEEWMSEENSAPYFYVGVEKEDGSWWTTEQDSLMLRGYNIGDDLKGDVKVLSNKKQSKLEKTLDEMKLLVDKNITYSQQGDRTSLTPKGLEGLDCSETVARYLHKLGITDTVKQLYTGVMTTENEFQNAIDSNKISFVKGSEKKGFKPKKGDIFVWRSSGGHTGIVYEYNEEKDVVTVLEAIGKSGSGDEKTNKKFGGTIKKGCTRTAIYKRTGKALFAHKGFIGYFRPK